MFRRNTVSAQTSGVPDQADNTFINGTIQIKWLGDVDGDGKVDFVHLLRWQPTIGVNPDNPFETQIVTSIATVKSASKTYLHFAQFTG